MNDLNKIPTFIPVSINLIEPAEMHFELILNGNNYHYSFKIIDNWIDDVKMLENTHKDIYQEGVVKVSLNNYLYNREVFSVLKFTNKKITFNMLESCIKKIMIYVKKIKTYD